MLALGNAVAGRYVIVAAAWAPAAGATVNGAFNCTVFASTIAATNRISPLWLIAWPLLRPWAALKDTRPPVVLDATAPPPKVRGVAPSADWNRGPYPGLPLFCHVVR